MGAELAACGTAVPLWEFGKEDPVYYESDRKCKLQFSEGDKKGAFPSENALLKLLYLRVSELYKKWNGRPMNNWAMVRNQLSMDEKIQVRIENTKPGDSDGRTE